jgi:SAM-dependent methyltransferase
MTDRKVVHRVEDGDDRQTIEATTYQMRNPYKQLRDGFFTHLDIMNYLHHHWIAKQARPGDLVLDVCCGRGIMLPLLRYHAPEIAGYIGVDLEPRNVEWLTKRVTDGKYLAEIPARREARPVGQPPSDEPYTHTLRTYYPFRVTFVESNAATMAEPITQAWWPHLADLIIYTQSIEHMHPDAGHASLQQCAELAAPGCRLVLSGPNTPAGQNGYDTRYRAHVYEWKRTELLDALAAIGWRAEAQWGLTLGKKTLAECMAEAGLSEQWKILSTTVPTEWLTPVLAPLFPQQAEEVAILATWPEAQLSLGA